MKTSIERAARAVIGYRETRDPLDRVRYSRDFLQHATALRDLDLSIDEAVDRIASEATSMLTRVDDEGFVRRPERRELEALIRELLIPLTSVQHQPSYSHQQASLRASGRGSSGPTKAQGGTDIPVAPADRKQTLTGGSR